MKKTRILLIFAILTTLANAQNFSRGLPIYRIDSITALEILDYVPDVFFPHQSEYIFRSMASKRLMEPTKNRSVGNAMERLQLMMADTINRECETHSINDELLISLIKQKPDSIEHRILKCYRHCDELATEYKKIFPSVFTRFMQSFKYGGADPTVKAYYSSQLSCYELMWTLGKLQSKYFDETKLNDHFAKLRNWNQNRDRIRYDEPHFEYDPKIAILDKPYNSIGEIDFLSIPILKTMFGGFNNDDKSWEYMLINNNMAYLVVGTQNGSSGGHGATFKLEIIEKTKLKITEIAAWVS